MRLQQIEDGAALSLELGGGCGAPDQSGSRPQRLSGCIAEFQRLIAEHDKNATHGSGKWNEADLDGVGHKQILQKSGL